VNYLLLIKGVAGLNNFHENTLQEGGDVRNYRHSYSFGKLGSPPLDYFNARQQMYGASMQKPILALINLILYKQGRIARRLTPNELNMMIAYSEGSTSSNKINRTLSKELSGMGVSHGEASEILEKMGLAELLPGVRWGRRNNQQTPLGYSIFMNLLHRPERHPFLKDFVGEAKEVLKYIKKRGGGTGADGLAEFLNQKLEADGYGKKPIKSIYGKGGYVDGTLNYSIIINNKYILSLYTAASKKVSRSDMRKEIQDLTYKIIKKNLTPDQFSSSEYKRQKIVIRPAQKKSGGAPQKKSGQSNWLWAGGRYGGARGGRSHKGEDLAFPPGTIVLLPMDAKVKKIGHVYRSSLQVPAADVEYESYGQAVYLETVQNSEETLVVMHLRDVPAGVSPGAVLSAGSALGKSYYGRPGNVEALLVKYEATIDQKIKNRLKNLQKQVTEDNFPGGSRSHIHVEYKISGRHVNPNKHIQFEKMYGGEGQQFASKLTSGSPGDIKQGKAKFGEFVALTKSDKPKNVNKSGGRFLKNYKDFYRQHPEFNFDQFYKALGDYLERGADGALPNHGKDYIFGPEHAGAVSMLNNALKEKFKKVEDEKEAEKTKQMTESKKPKVKILIKEFQGRGGVSDGGMPFGGFSPSGPAGTFRNNAATTLQPHQTDHFPFSKEEDLTKGAKVVMYRNGHVLLLKKKNKEEWDLPGGHIKRGEGTTNGLQREVFEETGLSLAPVEFRNLNLKHDNIEFYYATFPRDDIQKSHEHSGYKFFPVEQALQIEDMLPHYKEAIKKTVEQSGAPYSYGEITESTGPGVVVRIK